MAINIQSKQDISYLFSSFNTSNSTSGMLGNNWLSDYASIKNGSYGKLMKAYFNMDKASSDTSSDKKTSATEVSEESKKYAKVQTTSDALKESADALLETGEKSVFALKKTTTKDEKGEEVTTEGYDTEGIYKAVNNFVTNYNAVVNAAGSADNDRITKRAEIMVNESLINHKSLNAIGITLNENGTMTLDKEAFQKAEVGTVKNLFNGVGSYGYRISSQASMINYAANNASTANRSYTSAGQYGSGFSSGNLFESWF